MRRVLLVLSILLVLSTCKKEDDPTVVVNASVVDSSMGSIDFKAGSYAVGAAVTFSATPQTGYTFVSWTDSSTNQTYSNNPLTLNPDQNTTLVANFEKTAYNININVTGNGEVQKQVVGGGASFTHGATVELTAVPADQYSFFYWDNDPSDTTNPKSITLDGNKDVSAKFDHEVAKNLVGDWEFEIGGDSSSRNVTVIRMSVDIRLNVLMTTIVNGVMISQVFSQLVAISATSIVIGDFAVMTNLVVASATSLSMNMITLPKDTAPPTKESEIPDNATPLNLSGKKSEEAPQKDESGIIIPPTEATTSSSTTEDIGSVFADSINQISETQSSTVASETGTTSNTGTTTSTTDCSNVSGGTYLDLQNYTVGASSTLVPHPTNTVSFTVESGQYFNIMYMSSSQSFTIQWDNEPDNIEELVLNTPNSNRDPNIRGTPTTLGTFNFTLTGNSDCPPRSGDSNSSSGTITVIAATSTTGTTTPTGGGVGNTGTSTSTGGGGNNSGTTIPNDTTPPVITLNGQSSISLTVGDTYTEAGATASDNTDGNLTNNIVISGSVNTSSPGTYKVTYTVNDASSNTASIERTITITPDTTAPVITLNGQSSISLSVNYTYTEAGAIASDNVNGNLTNNIVITGLVNTSSPGTYTVTYTVSDASSNTASIARIIIITPDTTAPVITLIGQSIIDVRLNSNFSDSGANANDDVDGDISSSITISGTVNTSSLGTYIINYNVSDIAGNSSSVSRSVQVSSIYFENGTCKCPNATAGDTAVINGTRYTAVNNSTIVGQIANGNYNLCTTLVTNMKELFRNNSSFNSDIGFWDTSNVTNMEHIFASTPFNQNISNWDVSKVVTFERAFAYSSFNQPIGSWNISSATNISGMFRGSNENNKTVFNQDISGWNTSSIVIASEVFLYSIFNQNIGNWNMSNVRLLTAMFSYNTDFNQDISNWNLSSMTNNNNLINGANYGDARNRMEGMFRNATAFNQNLSNWCFPDISSEPQFFALNSPLSNANKPLWGYCPSSFSINVTASNASDYTLNGTDRTGNVSGNDPTVTINVGDTVNFAVNASGHPFYLKTVQGTGTANTISGVTNNGTTNGTVSWTPTQAGTYYYICSLHAGMVGTITVN